METQITFTKVGGKYVAEFAAGGNFALHIERAEAGAISLEMKSVEEGQYAVVGGEFLQKNRNALVIDEQVQAVVFPVYVRVTSATQPSMAVVVTA